MTDKERVVYLEGQVSMLTNALATARARLELTEEALRAVHAPHRSLAMENAVLARERDTARALAMEEAARDAEDEGTREGHEGERSQGEVAESIRALAPLPPSLCAVPRETIEKVKEALGLAEEWLDIERREQELTGSDEAEAPLLVCLNSARRALAALKDLP